MGDLTLFSWFHYCFSRKLTCVLLFKNQEKCMGHGGGGKGGRRVSIFLYCDSAMKIAAPVWFLVTFASAQMQTQMTYMWKGCYFQQ